MNSITSYIISVLVLGTSLSALQLNPDNLIFGKLRFTTSYAELNGTSNIFSEGIILNQGDVMEILNFTSTHLSLRTSNGYNSSTGGFLSVYTKDPDSTTYEKAIFHYPTNTTISTVTNELIGSYIVGPTTVYIGTPHPGGYPWDNTLGSLDISMTLHYAIERNDPLRYKNFNVISLPSSTVGAGTHEIVVEASDDLQTWTPVHSSSIGGNKAFFRTRVVEAGN